LFTNYGFCYCCNKNTRFSASDDWWRESYKCELCGSIPRERALMYCIEKFYPAWNKLVIHESSPVNRGTSLRLKSEAEGYIPSQYLPGHKSGQIVNEIRCEDLEKLSFPNNSVDLHISQDVFEHIFNPAAAFKEIARTLKPGGAHIFTTPLINKASPTLRCAKKKRDGSVEYLLNPPEYHNNPVSSEGSLVTMHWGYDIVDYIYQACGLVTEIMYIDDLDLGIRAEYIEVLVTRKPLNPHRDLRSL
jgi:SAM-dependent methyltransferase